MPDSGTELGADLYRLYRMAKVNLPAVAGQYAIAAGYVTDADLAQAFDRPAQFGGANGPAYQPWIDLRDRIRLFLSGTAKNLEDTAAALMLAVDAFAELDAGAAAEFNRLRTAPPRQWGG